MLCQCGTVEVDGQSPLETPRTDEVRMFCQAAEVVELRTALRKAARVTGWENPDITLTKRDIPLRPDHVREEEERRARELAMRGYEYPSDDDEDASHARAAAAPDAPHDGDQPPSDDMDFLGEVLGNAAIDMQVHQDIADRQGITFEEVETRRAAELHSLIEQQASVDRQAADAQDAAHAAFVEDVASPRASRSPRSPTRRHRRGLAALVDAGSASASVLSALGA